MATVEEVLEFMKTSDAKWVDLQFVGIDGQVYHKSVPAKNVNEETFASGFETELGEVFGFTGKSLALLPDQDTYARVPWEASTMRVISNVYTMPEKERFAKDSRYSIERVNINAKAMGISDVQVGCDVEFYIFDNVTLEKVANDRGPNYLVETHEGNWNPSPYFNAKNGAYIGQPHDTLYPARTQIAELMDETFRYAVDSHSHGKSANGQQRMKIREYNAKMAADALVTLKYVAKNTAFVANNIATFMPLPIASDRGNSAYITQRLKKGNANLFYDEKDDYAQLSQNALYYIGGLLEHAEALCLFAMPTTNSYKKMRADPRYSVWGKSQNALVQVSGAYKSEDRVVSYCGADSSINPYLAYTAVVAAGLDGIKNKTDPGKPVDENLADLDSKRAKELKIKPLPSSITEAIAALDSDNKFLKGFFSPELLGEYLEMRLSEQKENERRPTAFEIEKYFNR
ncbi:MAG: glutamine synthetase family protein [Candidatus Micrarchaeia archaeon]